MVQVTEGACQKGEEGVDTLQAAEPASSVSNGPVKINLKTSVSGGLLYKTPDRNTRLYCVYCGNNFKTTAELLFSDKFLPLD